VAHDWRCSAYCRSIVDNYGAQRLFFFLAGDADHNAYVDSVCTIAAPPIKGAFHCGPLGDFEEVDSLAPSSIRLIYFGSLGGRHARQRPSLTYRRFAYAAAGTQPNPTRRVRPMLALANICALKRIGNYGMDHRPNATAGFSLSRMFRVFALYTALLSSAAGHAEAGRAIKLAVFDLELDDFSAGGPIAGESAEETARLQRMTVQARKLLVQSGLFEIVDVSPSADKMVKEHWLRKCNGCDVEIARGLGAEMSFVGLFRKISVMEQYLEFRIRDVRSGDLVNISQTDLRGETDESWSRALSFLIKYRLVEPELARHSRSPSDETSKSPLQ
jgi:hypothetical protein